MKFRKEGENELLRDKHSYTEGSRSLRSLFSTNYDNDMKPLKVLGIQKIIGGKSCCKADLEQRNASDFGASVLSFIFLFAILVVLLSVNVSAQVTGENTICCEQTVGGAWCQNSQPGNCASGFRSAPASCDATSFCRLGTCVDSNEGICTENSPQRVCEDSNGFWEDGEVDEIPQCQLGCCVLGDQASFVTQTRCKKLSGTLGLETNFRTDIRDEVQCIASVTSEVKGACVFEEDFERTCRFITKRECADVSDGEFFEGTLCSAESLATNCGPTENTVCLEEKDEVHFVDSCGNVANVYDASQVRNQEYWSEVKTKAESCNAGNSNADSATCGNCDYFLGSTCKEFNRGDDRVRPNFGDNICRDLACEYEGNTYSHGETWCANAKGIDDSNPGSRHARLICYNGDVSVEACADFRQEVCIESEVNGFSAAACRVNQWQDCVSQDNQVNCENLDRRDCQWIKGVEGVEVIGGGGLQVAQPFQGSQPGGIPAGEEPFQGTETDAQSGITGQAIFGFGDDDDEDEDDEGDGGGYCVPKFAPGFNFWEAGDAGSICGLANAQCVVKYEKKFGGDLECVENCECLSSSVETKFNNACRALGDCGIDTNYLGGHGFGEGIRVLKEEVDND